MLADATQRAEALDLSRHVIAVAPAGSGKTGLLVQRFLAALATVDQPEQVVAITFTNKAAAEIRERICTLLERAAGDERPAHPHDARSLELAHAVLRHGRQRGWALRANPSRLQASTIDGFNGRIAAELPLLSGLGGRPQVTDDGAALYEEALLALFDTALESNADPALARAAAAWLRNAANRIDRLLGPFAALLAHRDQWGQAVLTDAWDDDAVLESLHRDCQQRFHAALGTEAADRLLDIARTAARHDDKLDWAAGLAHWPVPGADAAETQRALARLLVTDKGTLRKPAGISKKLGFPPHSPATAQLKAFLAECEDDARLEAAAAAVASAPAARFPAALLELRDQLRILLRHALAQLQLTMAGRAETDYTQIALAALQALRPAAAGGEDDIAQAEIYGDALLASDSRIRHLLVDEMQDTSETQIKLLEQLTQEWQPDDGHSLFLVGDPQQSIYAFRNARVALFMQLWEARRLGTVTLTPIRLSVNFRSAPALIAWLNDSFAGCFPKQDDLYTGQVAYTPAQVAQTHAAGDTLADRPGDAGTDVAVAHAFTDQAAEAEAVADRAAELIGNGAGNIAILARARTHLPAVLAGLRARHVRYICQDIDALQALPAVRDVLACARALWHPEDRLHWAILLRAPWVGLSWADLVALSAGRRERSWIQRLRETPPQALSDEGRIRVARLLAALDADAADRNCLPLADRVARLWLQLGGPACGDSGELADARRALQLLRTHAGVCGFEDLRSFERAVDKLYASPADGAVQVMTIHKAKGLEFDHVLLVGCGRKTPNEKKPPLHLVETPHGALLVPQAPEHWPDELRAGAASLHDYAHRLYTATRHNEGLRLLYVAATRARHTLHLYATLKPHKDGSLKPPARSFAEALWQPHFAAAFEALGTAKASPAEAPLPAPQPPRAPRLDIDFVVPEDDTLFVPRERRTMRPSEGVLSALQIKREDGGHARGHEESVYARLVGTLYHQAMQRIAEQGSAAWTQAVDTHPAALAAGFRRLGMPEPQVDKGVARVLALVERSLQSRDGRWLLAEKVWAQAEYALSGYIDGEWVAAAIDRCFEEADGTLWVVDYKTTAEPVLTDAVPAYVAACCRHYAPQLAAYARLLAIERNFSGRIKTALYLAEPDQLVEVGSPPGDARRVHPQAVPGEAPGPP